MSSFTKENLTHSRGWITYWDENGESHFVARFKGVPGAARSFMTHLRKHWTPEAYFEATEAGKTPLEAVRSTGYVLPHVKKMLREAGFPPTQKGYELYRQSRGQ